MIVFPGLRFYAGFYMFGKDMASESLRVLASDMIVLHFKTLARPP